MTPHGPELALALLLAAPAVGAGATALVRGAWTERIARGSAGVTFGAAVALLVLHPTGRWGGYFGVDPVSDLFLFLVASIYALSTWYSRGYLAPGPTPFLTASRYYALLAAFAFAMVFTLSVTDLGLMWVGLEGTTIASALLIVLERRPASVEAAWRYTLIASAGLAVALFGLIILYGTTGTLDSVSLAAHPVAASLAVAFAVALALVGYGTKVGLFPMHTWLPDAHSEAPSPISALLSGVLLPTALYAFLRVYAILARPVPAALSDLVLLFGLATALVAALLLQRQRSYKRLFAYSSMEVMGVAVVGVGLGGIALYGAIVLVVAHAFAKSAAFFCSGQVLRRTGTARMDELHDLRSRLPLTSGSWALSAAAVTGAPPFGTFLGEVLILAGALSEAAYVVAAVLLVALALSFLGVNYQIGRVIFGSETAGVVREPEPLWQLAPLWVGLGVCLALGLGAVPYLSPLIRSAAVALGGTL
ncbi:MAG: proton-conducting transporter transmembrane domain-containing protein [Thermoplasmata archaeon]